MSLRAYSAATLGAEIYNSSDAGHRATRGTIMKFTVPLVANGDVYIGTGDSLVMYGLITPPTAPPARRATWRPASRVRRFRSPGPTTHNRSSPPIRLRRALHRRCELYPDRHGERGPDHLCRHVRAALHVVLLSRPGRKHHRLLRLYQRGRRRDAGAAGAGWRRRACWAGTTPATTRSSPARSRLLPRPR